MHLLDHLPKTEKNELVLLDTCFLIDLFEHHKEHELTQFAKEQKVAITSFNAEELDHVVKKHHLTIRKRIKDFFKDARGISILDIPVHPGDREGERKYVADTDPYLAEDVPDPSDAVLIAAAIMTRSTVLTKDKHHLFTVLLENYLQRYGLGVYKTFHDARG